MPTLSSSKVSTMPVLCKTLFSLCTVVFLLSSGGCALFKQSRVASVALTVEDVARAASKQSDLTLIREGTPAYLMLLDGLIESYPDNRKLLTAGAQAYSSYASLLPEDENRQKTLELYRKAMLYGFRALSHRGDFQKAASGSLEDFTTFLQRYTQEDVPALFYTASSWASWISANLSSVEAVAELPMMEATLKRVIELDDTFYYGSPHLLMGVYLAARPAAAGGDPVKAKEHFDRALALAGDLFLPAKLFYAQYYATAVKDRSLFEKTLEEVLTAPADTVPELTLTNTAAKEKAKQLLNKTEEYFEIPS